MNINAPDLVRGRVILASHAVLASLLLPLTFGGCKPKPPEAPEKARAKTNATTNLPSQPATAIVYANAGKDPFREPKLPKTSGTNLQTALVGHTNPPGPFDPPGFPNLLLERISFHPGNPSAVINGHTQVVGRFINGAMIVAITPQAVTLEYRGMRKTLEIEFPPLEVQEIVLQPTVSAKINGRTVAVGDALEDVKVVSIESNKVIVEFKGAQKVLAWQLQFPAVLVEGIIFTAIKPSAIINGHSVAAGDTVDGMKVLEIRTNYVKLEYKGMTQEFPLAPRKRP